MSIKYWFLPAHKNKFHPHALRPFGLLIFLALFVTIPFLYNVTSAKNAQVLGYATNISVGDVFAITNQERASNSVSALALSSQLNAAATAKANHMFTHNYWAHVAPDGTTPWSLMYSAGYNYSAAGENLAKNFNTSAGVVNGWMNSATHRANMLNGAFTEVGFAVVDGTLLGSETTLVVAMYGSRVATPAAPAVPAPSPAPEQPTTPVVVASESTPVVAEPAAPAPATTVSAEPVVKETEKDSPKQAATIGTNTAQSVGEVEGLMAFAPVRAYAGMNWGQKVSLVLLAVLALLFVMKHTIVWRQQRRGIRHVWLRSHPLSQMVLLVSVFVVTALAGTGTIL
jgi:uncharacterized protein YkwD